MHIICRFEDSIAFPLAAPVIFAMALFGWNP